jgi:hypothetical protein
MTMEKIKRIIPYAIVLMISVYFYILAGRFGFNARAGNLGPDFWPKLLLGLTMVVCLYEIAKTALFHRVKALEEDTGEEKAGAEKRYPGLLIIGTLMTVAYVYVSVSRLFYVCRPLPQGLGDRGQQRHRDASVRCTLHESSLCLPSSRARAIPAILPAGIKNTRHQVM